MSKIAGWLLLVTLSVPDAAAPSDKTHASAPERLQALLGPQKRLRDYAPFVTERGESAKLLLFVTGAIDPPADAEIDPDNQSCPGYVAGIALRGTYHVALVIGGKLINEVTIPGVRDYAEPPGPTCCLLALPLKNTAQWNYNVWGQGRPTKSNCVAPTKLIRLADFNGDGHAWEFRLVQPGSCADDLTLLAGYSAAHRKAIIFRILEHGHPGYWADNFFPHPSKPNASSIRSVYRGCDWDLEAETESNYAYNARQEAWILTSERSRDCYEGRPHGPWRKVPPPPARARPRDK